MLGLRLPDRELRFATGGFEAAPSASEEVVMIPHDAGLCVVGDET